MWGVVLMSAFKAFSLLKQGNLFQFPPFLGHRLLINIQETSFQGKIKTGVGITRLVYNQQGQAVIVNRPFWRTHRSCPLNRSMKDHPRMLRRQWPWGSPRLHRSLWWELGAQRLCLKKNLSRTSFDVGTIDLWREGAELERGRLLQMANSQIWKEDQSSRT